MLFPGIRKLGKQLVLYSSGSVVFGLYRDYRIAAFDGNNKKILQMYIERSISPDVLDQLQKKYKFKEARFIEKHSILEVEFRELFKPYSYKKIIQLCDELIDICVSENISSISTCTECEDPKVEYYSYNEMPVYFCESCYEKESAKLKQAELDYKNQDSRYIQAFSAAVLFAIPGIILQACFFIFLNRIVGVSSLIYCVLAVMGFNKLKGKATPFSASILMFLCMIVTLAGTFVSYAAMLLYQTHSMEWVFKLLGRPDIQGELQLNITIQLIVSAFFLVFQFISLRKAWAFKHFKTAAKLV